ncbi:hypothetical protein ACFVYD_36610, partial [Streptomyces sp. NPDC058301]
MEQGPDPAAAHSPAQFVELMRQLRRWADLSYRQLERTATDVGDVLPRATISAALSRDELPRAELLAAYVRACGGDDDAVTAWLNARRRLSISGTATPPPAPAGEDAQRTTAETNKKSHATQQETAAPTPTEAAANKQEPGATQPNESTSATSGPSATPGTQILNAPPGGTPRPPTTWRRRGPLVAIAACTVIGLMVLAVLWPSHDGPDSPDGHAGSPPQSAQPPPPPP